MSTTSPLGQHGSDPILEALRTLTGRPDAELRPGQREAIEALVDRGERALVVQRTGWGKSAVYFVATQLLRGRGMGPTLLISPLLALMRNQIEAAERLGLRCLTVNSAAATTVDELAHALESDRVDLVLVSPERLANPEFAAAVLPVVEQHPGLVVIDEVHCISDWGHDFRPDYRRIGRLLARYGDGKVPVLGCTATANDRVVDDVAAQLGVGLTVVRGQLHRDGLALGVVELPRRAERLAWLAAHIDRLPGSGIVYCLTIRDTEIVADWLRRHAVDAESYSGQTDTEQREALEARLQRNDIKALVATTALGMGYDKPDLGFVVHFQMPGSPIGYYQQVGRAGRALAESRAILLSGAEDVRILDHFRNSAFPSPQAIEQILAVLDAAPTAPLSIRKIAESVDISLGQIELGLKQLDVEGAVRRVKGQTYVRSDHDWTYPAERVANVTDARQREQQLMLEYLASSRCRMQYLTEQLDDRLGAPCGVCDNCDPSLAADIGTTLPTALVGAADRFLRHRPIILEPKKQGVAKEERNEVGRVLGQWGDGGWGDVVERAKYDRGEFGDDLVEALHALVTEWSPTPPAEWVTAVPSNRTDPLVSDLAQRLADRLGLPFIDAVMRIDERSPQRDMQNFASQRSNVRGAFQATERLPASPGLLVDDESASGWTFAEVGALLRRNGATAVHPLGLSATASRR